MGLKVNTYTLMTLDHWPKALVEAIEDMKIETQGRSVVPSSARKLIAKYIDPLKPGLDISSEIRAKHPSWADFKYAGMIIERNSNDRMGLCIGSFLMYLPDWASSKKSPKTVVRTHCEMCWRHAVGGRKFCGYHDPRMNQARYRLARRMLYGERDKSKKVNNEKSDHINTYIEMINRLHFMDQVEANDEWFKVTNGQGSLDAWLRKFRPRVIAIVERYIKVDGPLTPLNILNALDEADQNVESKQTIMQREKLHNEILADPDQLSKMLTRAEAWLAIEQLYRKEHAKGRPKKYLST